MPQFLCLLRSLAGEEAERPSPTQMQEMYAQLGTWQQKFSENLVDMGGKIGAGLLSTSDRAPDGPFVEIRELGDGYMIVWAETLDQAIDGARACPGLVGPGSGVEVIEIRGP